MTDAPILAAVLPADLREAAGVLGVIASCRSLTTLPLTSDARACWRVDYTDGRSVKVRRLPTRDDVARMSRAYADSRSPHLPRLVGTADRIVIESWIPGRPLDSIRLGPSLARRCGEALGSLHCDRPAIDLSAAALRAARRREALANLGQLVAAAALDARQAARVAGLLETVPIDGAEAGIIHGDFCGENAVLAADGSILAIDNETMRPELLDYDLGRVWYRWPMTRTARVGFLEGYAARRSPATFLAHARGWALHGLVDSASYRLAHATARAGMPLAAIVRLLDSPDDDPLALLAPEAADG